METANQRIYDRIRYCEIMTIREIAFTLLHEQGEPNFSYESAISKVGNHFYREGRGKREKRQVRSSGRSFRIFL